MVCNYYENYSVQIFFETYIFAGTFNESVSTIIERKVRGWLSGVIDDMRRSSPVQQWLDSLPADGVENTPEKPDDGKTSDVKSDDSKAEESATENTVVEATDEVQEEQNLDVPSPKEWKRKSLESGVLTSAPPSNIRKRLQRDHSVQSEGYSPKLKNPLLRDYSLQVLIS